MDINYPPTPPVEPDDFDGVSDDSADFDTDETDGNDDA